MQGQHRQEEEEEEEGDDDDGDDDEVKEEDEHRTYLSENYQPSKYDVVCGRGRRLYSLPGNKRFRFIVSLYVSEYIVTNNKNTRSIVLDKIAKQVCEPVLRNNTNNEKGYFIQYDTKKKRWYQIPLNEKRDKIGHAMRDMVACYHKKKQVFYENRIEKNENNKNNNDNFRLYFSLSLYYREKQKQETEKQSKEEKMNNTVVLLPEDYRPSRYDIVFGKNWKTYENHPGNQFFRQLLASYVPQYNALRRTPMKMRTKLIDKITNEVYKAPPQSDDNMNNNNATERIIRRGVRYDSKMKRWQLMSKKKVYDRTACVIRTLAGKATTKTCGSAKDRKQGITAASPWEDGDDNDDAPWNNIKGNRNEHHHHDINKKGVIASSSNDDDDEQFVQTCEKNNAREMEISNNKNRLTRKLNVSNNNNKKKQKVMLSSSLVVDDNSRYTIDQACNQIFVFPSSLSSNKESREPVNVRCEQTVQDVTTTNDIKCCEKRKEVLALQSHKMSHERVIPSSLPYYHNERVESVNPRCNKMNIQQECENSTGPSILLKVAESFEKKAPKLISTSFHQRMNIEKRILNNETILPVMKESVVVTGEEEELVTASEGGPTEEMTLSLSSSSSYERNIYGYDEACENTERYTISRDADEKHYNVLENNEHDIYEVKTSWYEILQKENALSSYESMVLDDDKTIDFDNMTEEEAAASECKSKIQNIESSSISDKEIIEPITDELCETTEPVIIREDFVSREKIQKGIATSSAAAAVAKQTEPSSTKIGVNHTNKKVPVLQQKQKQKGRRKHKNLISLKKVQQKLFHKLLVQQEPDDNYVIYSNMMKKPTSTF